MQYLVLSHQIGQSVQLVTSLGTLEVTGAPAPYETQGTGINKADKQADFTHSHKKSRQCRLFVTLWLYSECYNHAGTGKVGQEC